MKLNTPASNGAVETARAVLDRCVEALAASICSQGPPVSKIEARTRLLSSLHESFEAAYYSQVQSQRVAVLSLCKPATNLPLRWKRSEFLHDVSVVEVGETSSAYNGERIGFVRRALWQVESEISNNGRDVAEDLSKLTVGRADNKLLVTARPKRFVQPWLEFLSRVWCGNEGPLFVATIDSYAAEDWRVAWCREGGPRIDLYQLEPDAAPSVINLIASLGATRVTLPAPG